MKILLVTTRWPWPPRRGNELRTVQWVEALCREHDVTLIAPKRPPDPAPPVIDRLRVVATRVEPASALLGAARALLRGRALQAGLYHSRALGRAIRQESARHDLAIAQLVRLEPYLRDLAQRPLAVDLIDSLSLNFARRAELDRWWKAPALAFEARRLAQAEDRFLGSSSLASVVCQRDLDDLARRSSTRLGSRLRVVALAVPTRPATPSGRSGSGAGTVQLLLSGNLGYFPTAEGARWWLRSVWPAVRASNPALVCRFAGARPGEALCQEARRAGVEVVVDPPDLRSLVAGADLSLAPARAGSGVPVKVLEAWAEGVPVVASPWTAAGVAGRHGHDLWIADSASEWVTGIGRLVADRDLRQRLAVEGRRRVALENDPETVAQRVRDFAVEAFRRRAT
jgi:glycosyltransferase involved in cell wall biosynthesis